MIYGLGTDVVQIERVEQTYTRFGEHFADRLLMPEELEGFQRVRRKARYLAMRFAGKEAIAKAMGTGFSNGIWIRDIGVVQNAQGKPEVVFSERGRAVCARLGIGAGHVSLTDEVGLVFACAVLEKAGG